MICRFDRVGDDGGVVIKENVGGVFNDFRLRQSLFGFDGKLDEAVAVLLVGGGVGQEDGVVIEGQNVFIFHRNAVFMARREDSEGRNVQFITQRVGYFHKIKYLDIDG